MSDFPELWKAAVRFRRASRELEALLERVHDAFGDEPRLRDALEAVLTFLSSAAGRTDANCSTTYYFVTATEPQWTGVGEGLRGILDDMSGTLHESIYAPDIARTFQATPEQLLDRVRGLNSSS